MKSRLFATIFVCVCVASLCWAQENKSTLPLPDSGNVTLTLDEYNKLVELAAKTPKKPSLASIVSNRARAAIRRHGLAGCSWELEECGFMAFSSTLVTEHASARRRSKRGAN